MTTRGTDPSPGDYLVSLLRRFSLSQRQQAVILVVLLSPDPLTSRAIARKTGLAYSHAKAIVRTLIAWGFLTRAPRGVSFQSDPGRWGELSQ